MLFKTLEIQNFMAIRTAKIELDNCGLVLIKGDNQDNPNFQSNGAGKSSIIESLVYVLFGRTIRGVRGDDVVNRVGKANCKVVLDIVDDDGTLYKISRYRKHKEHKNNVYLLCNGKDITPKSESDFTQYIIDLLQTDFLTFTSSILYSAESFKFTQATDSELKNAFDVMLDLKVYSDCLEEVKKELREISSSRQVLDTNLSKLDSKKIVLEESKHKAEEWSKEYDSSKSKDISTLRSKIEELFGQIDYFEDELSKIKDDMDLVSSEIKQLESKKKKSSSTDEALKTLRSSIEESEDEKSEYKDKLRKTKRKLTQYKENIDSYNSNITSAENKIIELNKKLKELHKKVGTPCPVCGKPLDEDHIVDAVKEVEEQILASRDKIKNNEEEISLCEKSIEDSKLESEEIESHITEIEESLREYSELLSKVQERQKKEHEIYDKILNKEREFNRIEKQYNSKKLSIGSLKSKIDLYEQQIDEKQLETNPYEQQIEDYEKRISELQPQYDSLELKRVELKKEEDLLNFWVSGFSNSGIKSMLLDDITPFLNKKANKYLRALSGDHVSVNFTTQTKLKSGEMREKFQIEVENIDGGNTYMSNSSGEKKRVDIAINLALQDLIASRANKKINVIFLDEILDALDSAGVEDVLNLLTEVAKDKSSVFVISHNENIQTSFEKFLVVTKKNGYSTVELC